MVSCPICSENISLSNINDHLDTCELKRKRANKNESITSPANAKSDSESVPTSPLEQQIKREPESQPSKLLTSLLSGNKKKEKPRTYQYQPSQHQTINSQPDFSSVNNKRLQTDDTRLVEEVKKSKKEIIEQLKLTCNLPLSERLRPTEICKYIGQSHLVGDHGILRGYLKHGRIPSLILWGKPGTGKTTLARILAKTTHMRFIEMSGVINGVADCKKVFEEALNEMKLTRRSTIIFVDEIHRFTKSQQDIFLNYVERGIIILIGATTENPSFTINKAILSRCRVFTLEKLTNTEMKEMVGRGLVEVNKVRKLVFNTSVLKLSKEAIEWMVTVADGDGRQALGFIEMIDSNYSNQDDSENSKLPSEVDLKAVKELLKKSPMLYDRVGDAHYDTISAFHKSIRGSNPDAALFYLARMLSGGEDPLYIARRMIVIASEDIGEQDQTCLPFATATYQAVQFVGLPEAEINMAHCAVKLARAPKSIEVYRAWKEIKGMVNQPEIQGAEIPMHLRNAPTKLMKDLGYSKGYKYNPNYKDGKVKQTYFPDSIGEQKFLCHQHLGDLIDEDL
jgi:putative ATPase